MITISCYKLENPLIFDENTAQVLVIESPTEFYSVVSGLLEQFDGKEGDFAFFENEKSIDCQKTGFIVADIFGLDLNDKKLQNLLYKKLEKNFNEDTFILQYNQINCQISAFLQDLCFTLPLAMEFDELSLQGILKESSLKIQKTYDSLLEKIICFINLIVVLKNCKFVVFVNLKSVLNQDEIAMLYSHCQNEKIALLLIESHQPKTLLPNEKLVIITSDLCEIIANISQTY